MGKRFFLLLFLAMPIIFQAQILEKPVRSDRTSGTKKVSTEDNLIIDDTTRLSRSSSKKITKNLDAKISDYKIISFKNDTIIVDTTLTIHKEYKFNYLRKDNFDLMRFSNIGQSYNTLSKDFSSTRIMPRFGASSKHFNYMEIEDLNYYHVPTPLTELMYKSAFEQGQMLDAFFSVNTSQQLNFSFAYKGLRSLGKYQNILTSTGNFRFTTNFKTKNNKYNMRAHIVMQDVLNEENGGLQEDEIVFFETGDADYIDRSIFDMNFQNAEGTLRGKRFYLEHSFALINKKDSVSENKLKIQNILSLEDKYYDYNQSSVEESYFGDAFTDSEVFNKVKIEEFFARFGAAYKNNIIGELSFALNLTDYNYGYNTLVVLDDTNISNRLKGNVVGFNANYAKSFNKFNLSGELGSNISGDFTGNYLMAAVKYSLNENNNLQLQLNSNSKAPDYNFQLFQSDYKNYNWQNNFRNIQTNQFSARLNSKKIINLSADLTAIDNFTYFKKDETTELVKPFQNDNTISYIRVKANKELKYKKFSLDNTLMYQKVTDEGNSFNVPELITRNTLYYSNHFFKKALYLQTGVTLKYFTKYNMNAYDPLLSEFYVQNNKEYGGFPMLDFFINAKVRQTRIFLKAEHFNSAWTGYDYYSAPNYPYRDFTVRFGLVWNFFL